jgi:branched-chain amino acid transport system permease protein
VYTIGKAHIATQQILVILAMLAIVISYDVFLRKTIWGRSIRAIAHNPDTSTLLGVPTKKIIKFAFILGMLVVVGIGFFAAPILIIAPAAGLTFTIQGFTAAVIGGVGSPRGAVVGGLTIGILDSVVKSLLGGSLGLFSTFIALALILIVKPNGLFGKRVEGR